VLENDKVTTESGPDYAAWAARIEGDDRPARPTGKGLSGAAARRYAITALEDAAETTEEKNLVRSLGGRPTLDPTGTPSAAWRLRVPSSLDEQFRAQAVAEGRTFSEVLRSAAEEYMTTHAAAR